MATMQVPDTSTTLLRDVADPQHARWVVFHSRYQPMMAAYLRSHFPSLDLDDVIQETFAALVQVLPNYVYDPKETGHFHNYLTGVLRHRALRMLDADSRRVNKELKYAETAECFPTPDDEADDRLKESVLEIALQQLLADESVTERTKQIFIRTAVNGEKPGSVAGSFGMNRNAVDQIKARMKGRLRELANALPQHLNLATFSTFLRHNRETASYSVSRKRLAFTPPLHHSPTFSAF